MKTSKEIVQILQILTADVMDAYNNATGENLLSVDNEMYSLLEMLPAVIKEEKKSHAIGFMDELSTVISKDGIKDFYRNSKMSKTI